MSINDKIKVALSELDIPAYFITRAENKAPCIVYNYIETPKYFSDNTEKSTQYTVLINLYSLTDIENSKKIVLDTMKKNDFMKTTVQSTMLDDSGFFNTPMQFKICLRSDINE
ncbi:MAG: hypothetical protein ACRC7S_14850 [Cetobacterium sp.]